MTEITGIRTCEICRSRRNRILFRQHFSKISGSSLLEEYNIVSCRECGYCFANNIPDQNNFDTYYREMSKYEHQEKMGYVSDYDMRKFQLLVNFLLPYISDYQARVVEIGCSTGALLSLIKNTGLSNIFGVDPSPLCKEIAQKLYGIQVLTNTLSNIDIEDGSVEVLILVGVLEHVRDLNSSLAQCRRMLADRGLVYISVPDASRYFEGEDAPFQEFSPEHINFFGPISLTNLSISNGFKLVALERNLVEVSYRTYTPIINAIFQKTNEISVITLDNETEPGLIAYIERSNQIDNYLHSIISEIANSGRQIVVWGTGSHTLRLLASTRLKEANILAFVDSNPRYQGKDLHGIPIVSPQSLDREAGEILISSRVYQREIEEQIRSDLRLDNKIITLYAIDM